MGNQSNEELRSIFDRVIRQPLAEREAALDRECRGDGELKRSLEQMLAASTLSEDVGARIGPYQLVQRLGEGGFGVVFLATQERPVRRTVALKIIKVGMDTRQVVARFEQERQALAMMDHPNIARALDAGETASGRPYFVMELVRGVPIIEYCDQNKLSTRERLDLFVQVCHALQHAHQKGIIHRDIKPSNVLVALVDGVPVPKVIDFGIAKATTGPLTDKTLFTEHRQLIGTPAYVSPEQAGVTGLDVDTRTDIYSLGVLLYELLTGTTPFDVRRLLEAGFGEIQRVIREVDPPKPSTRVSSLGSTLTKVAAMRRTAPQRLGAIIRGDLDWIVMKALEKDRTRRYESATALANDVQCHLHGEPVIAAPPSAAYRLRKFVRRRRGLVAAAGAVAAMMALAIVGTGLGWVAARRSADAEREARRGETEQRQRAERSLGFLRDVLASVDPAKAPGREVTVRDLLDAAAAKVGTALGDTPEEEAALRQTLGESYNQLSRYQESREQFQRVVELRTRALGTDHRDTLAARYGLGVALLQAGDVIDAKASLQATLSDQSRLLGDHDPDTVATRGVVGFALQLTGEREEALRIYREVLPDQDGNARLETMSSIADVLQDLGRLGEALEAAQEMVAAARAAEGPDGLQTLSGESVLLSVLTDLGRYQEAEPIGRRVLEAKTRIYGVDHSSTIVTTNALAIVLERLDKFDEAIDILQQARSSSLRTLGSEHDTTLAILANLARNRQLRGDLDEAERLFREVLAVRRRVSGDTAMATLAVMNNLGLSLLARDRDAEAEPILREMASGVAKTMPAEHWMQGQAMVNLARSLVGQEKYAEAESLLLAGYEKLVEALPEGHERRGNAAATIAAMYAKWGKPAEAGRWQQKK